MATKKTIQKKSPKLPSKKAVKRAKPAATKPKTKKVAAVKKTLKAPAKKKGVKKLAKTKKIAKPAAVKPKLAKKAAAKKVSVKKTAVKKQAVSRRLTKKTKPTRGRLTAKKLPYSLNSGKILVTGGAGFIGSALIQALNERGIDNILVTDILGEDDRYKNLVSLRFDEYLEADDFIELLADEPSLFDDIQTVFHLGACSDTTERDARYLIQNNTAYTQGLAAWALGKGARFVYASSAATYGDGSAGMSEDVPLEALRPLNMYGYSKHRFDCYAQQRGWLPHLVGLKYFNVFGPNEGHKGNMRSMVAKAYEQIQKTGSMGLFKSYHPDYADGEQKRDFLYVRDAVRMTLFLAEHPQASGLYNIGSGIANTWNELAFSIFNALGKEPSIEYIDMPESLRSQYQYYTCSDNARLKELGYQETITPLADAVNEYVTQYLALNKHLGD